MPTRWAALSHARRSDCLLGHLQIFPVAPPICTCIPADALVCIEGTPMPYVQELRAIVGQHPLILVAAGVLICNPAGELLLQRRSDDQLWGIPGGSMELGESAEETARREVWEETGLTVGELRLFGVFSGPEMRHVY